MADFSETPAAEADGILAVITVPVEETRVALFDPTTTTKSSMLVEKAVPVIVIR